MVSDVSMEKPLLGEPAGVILESLGGDFAAMGGEEADRAVESEYDDDLALTLAWITNIG